MLNSILVGLVMAAATIAVHGGGTTLWIRFLMNSARRANAHAGTLRNLLILCSTAVALLTLHIVEVILWAVVYLWLVGQPRFADVEEAIYFSTVTYSSLGFGDIVIAGRWRLLSAIQAMVGLLAFGWSSALLFAVVQRILVSNEVENHRPN